MKLNDKEENTFERDKVLKGGSCLREWCANWLPLRWRKRRRKKKVKVS